MKKASSIFDLIKLLEAKSYLDLTKHEKEKVDGMLKKDVDAWSFIPHPLVIDRLTKSKIFRYFIIIETLRASIYYSIKNFLERYKLNINSYYTGGSADFIVDAYLTDTAYLLFFDSLVEEITELAKSIEKHPENLITVFKVRESLILGGKNLVINYKPDEDTIDEIIADPHKFELVVRNYLSEESLKHFGSHSEIKKYLNYLKRKNILLGYKIVYDFCRGIDRQYIPLGQATLQVNNLLSHGNNKPKSDFLKPITELLAVIPTHCREHADQVVSHISINEYKAPTDRHLWRVKFYDHDTEGSVNLFSYPIEGTLNESPLELSDLPEIMENAKPYLSDELHLGKLSHQNLTSNTLKVGLPTDSLPFQGLTLGDAGIGKTTTDLTLIVAALEKVETVIILDDTKSFKGKAGLIKDKYIDNDTFIELSENISLDTAMREYEKAQNHKGLSVIECHPADYPTLLKAAINIIINQEDQEKDGNPRVIKKFLLIEEAHGAFGTGADKNKIIEDFLSCITKAWRKGWCIWISTQAPSLLGYDNNSIKKMLEVLQNKIIHKISSANEIKLIVQSTNNLSKSNQAYLLKSISNPPSYSAIVMATIVHENNQGQTLLPILVKIDQPSKK
jgi:hypothetical protein